MNPNSEWEDENDETIVFDSDAAKESIKNIKCTFIKLVLNQISRLKNSVNESSQEFETSESLKVNSKKQSTGYTKSSQSFKQSNVNTTISQQASKAISKSESQVTGVIECGEDPIIIPTRQHFVKSSQNTQLQQEPSPPQIVQQQPQWKLILKFLKAGLLLAFILWSILFIVSYTRQQFCYHFPIRNMFLGKAFVGENNENNDEFVSKIKNSPEEKYKNNQLESSGKSDENQTDQPSEKKEDLPLNIKSQSKASLKLGVPSSNKSNNELTNNKMSVIPAAEIEQQRDLATRTLPTEIIMDCSFSKNVFMTILFFFATIIVFSSGTFLAMKLCDCLDKGYGHNIPNKFIPY